jgi:hypothetical protein
MLVHPIPELHTLEGEIWARFMALPPGAKP